MENELKPTLRVIDLAVAAGRKRQSPRTGFVHFFSTDENASDTIPLFENFCFVLGLLRQRNVDSVLEGKEILERLLEFQTPEGNFPIYIHDFPRCYDGQMSLKIAPILVQILNRFGSVLGETKDKIARAIAAALRFAEHRERSSLWEDRFRKLRGENTSFSPSTQEEWYHWLISEQLGSASSTLKIPYHSALKVFTGGSESQEKGEPKPSAIEWVLAEQQGFPDRLLRDHPSVLSSAILFPVILPPDENTCPWLSDSTGVRLLWGGKKLHSLSAPGGKLKDGEIEFELLKIADADKRDLVEAAFFCDISAETELTVEGKKGTIFELGESIRIHTPILTIDLCFELKEGGGDFCGQISRANRPSQTACKGPLLYEAFDWRIALRTLRRSTPCRIIASVSLGN